jgi:hypothetical protein
VALLSLALIAVVGAAPAVHAITVIIKDSASCGAIGGTWDSLTSTCTFSGTYTLTSGNFIEVSPGTTLVINGGVINGIWIYGGTIYNYGIIEVANTAGYGIWNAGTISNSGTIKVANTGGIGIWNAGTITDVDCGTVTIVGSGTFLGNAIEYTGTCAPTKAVPEFPVSALGPLLITALLLPALLVMTRRFRRPLLQ